MQFGLLHQRSIWANRQRVLFDEALATEPGFDEERFMWADSTIRMYVWYGLLWAVLEGLADRGVVFGGRVRDDIEDLADDLRRCRNAVFPCAGERLLGQTTVHLHGPSNLSALPGGAHSATESRPRGWLSGCHQGVTLGRIRQRWTGWRDHPGNPHGERDGPAPASAGERLGPTLDPKVEGSIPSRLTRRPTRLRPRRPVDRARQVVRSGAAARGSASRACRGSAPRRAWERGNPSGGELDAWQVAPEPGRLPRAPHPGHRAPQ